MSDEVRIITPEDMLLMEDEGAGYELVNGTLMPLSFGVQASYVAGRFYFQLSRHCDATQSGWVFPQGASYQCFPRYGIRVRRPDVSFIQFDRMSAREYREPSHCTIVPDLVVDVVRTSDLAYQPALYALCSALVLGS